MAKKYGKLPHEILFLPYGLFLLDAVIFMVGEEEIALEVLQNTNADPIALIANKVMMEL